MLGGEGDGAARHRGRVASLLGTLHQQLALSVVVEIDESLVDHADTGAVALLCKELAEREQHEVPADRPCRLDHASRGLPVALGHACELAVWLDVLQLDPLCQAESQQATDLMNDDLVHLLPAQVHPSPPESREVRVRHVRAESNIVTTGALHGLVHRGGVGSVVPAGNAHRRDEWGQRLVVAQLIAPEGLSEIGVQVDAGTFGHRRGA